jgi:hypothetical protein
MPLGDAWSGVCRAAAAGEWLPDPQTVQQFCNFGYAREKCARVPVDGPDAVRFGISNDREDLIRIYWVMEKDHLPFAHGPASRNRRRHTSAAICGGKRTAPDERPRFRLRH